LVVLPELCAMLPDEPDHAKGRSAVAAKKVCKLMRHDARARPLRRKAGLVRGLQGTLRGVSAVVGVRAYDMV
jgi:hypothetical protein